MVKIERKLNEFLKRRLFSRIKSPNSRLVDYLENTSWLLLERIVRMVIVLFIGVLVARYLGPEKFGLLSYLVSFVGLFSMVAGLGLDQILVRNLVKGEINKDTLLGTTYFLKSLGASGAVLLILSLSYLLSIDLEIRIMILIISATMIFQAFDVIDLFFQSEVESKFVVFIQFINLLISSTLKLAFIYFQAPLIWFIWLILFESLIIATGLLVIYKFKNFSIYKWRYNKNIAITLLKDAWPLILSGIAISVYMKIDQVMLKEMLNEEAVGNYAVAVKLSEAWYFIPSVITSSLFPAIINAKKVSESFYYERIQKLYYLMILPTILISIITSIGADKIVTILFGTAYKEAGPVLTIHIWAGIFIAFGFVNGKWIIAENLTKIALMRSVLGATTNVIANLFLIPLWGIKGAAVATLIALAFSTHFAFIINKKLRVIFYQQCKSLVSFYRLVK